MSRKDTTEICCNCEFWDNLDGEEHHGYCRVYPKKMLIDESEIIHCLVPVYSDEWCGQFKRFETQEEMPGYGRV